MRLVLFKMVAIGMEVFVDAGKLRAEILGARGVKTKKHILRKENNLRIVQD
jgi:hypothetical protein